MQSEFIELSQRRLFLQSCEPAIPGKIATLVLPAFAEEMNKSRHLFSQCRQQLCRQGGSWFLLDPYGTGDSEGDLEQTDVLVWRDDLQSLLALLQQRGYQAMNVLAMRFGALQLIDLLAQATPLALRLHKVVLWQPQLQSTQFLQQFFRLKIAEQMAVGEKTSQKVLEQQLAAGEVLEIAGYPLTARFVDSIRQLKDVDALLSHLQSQQSPPIPLLWLETSNLPNLSPQVEKAAAQLSAAFAVELRLLQDAPYWNATELVQSTALVDATVQFLQEQV